MRRPLDSFTRISSTHGSPSAGSRFGKHLGIDYATPVGTVVKAPVSGVVIAVMSSSDVGKQVHLREDGNGRIWRFLHLSQQDIVNGSRVAEGQRIALSGNTGSTSTGPHLHCDVRRAGTAWNDSFDNYYDPEQLVAMANQPATTPASNSSGPYSVGDTVWLKPIPSWRVYREGKAAIKGTEAGFLLPANYNNGPNNQRGLTYRILAVTQWTNVYTIQTNAYGRVNIYLDGDAQKV